MRTRTIRSIVISSLVLCGCDRAASPTETDLATTAAPRATISSVDEMTSILQQLDVPILTPEPGGTGVTGGGRYEDQPFPSPVGSDVTFGFSAIRTPQGEYQGEFEYVTHIGENSPLPVQTIYTHGKVLCFSIVGSSAVIAGVITESNFDPVGMQVFFNAKDFGEGADQTQPDMVSGLGGWEATSACATHLQSTFQTPISGNIVIHH